MGCGHPPGAPATPLAIGADRQSRQRGGQQRRDHGVRELRLHRSRVVGPAQRTPRSAGSRRLFRPTRTTGLPFSSVAVSDRGLVAWALRRRPDDARRVGPRTPPATVGAHSPSPGVPVGLTFSPDGSQLAVMLDHSNSDLTVQLVSVPGMTPGPLLQGQHQPNAFNAITDQFQAAVVFSPDGRQVSVVASRGRTAQRAAYGATIATQGARSSTFDTRTGARLPAPTIAVGQEFLGVSPDLREIATLRHRHPEHLRPRDRHADRRATRPTVRLQPRTHPRSRSIPPGRASSPKPPPARSRSPTGPKPAPPISREPRIGRLSPVELAANGTPIDLTDALRTLGLSNRCFAPLMSNCDYTSTNEPSPSPEHPVRRRHPRRPWTAAASTAGEVAILAGTADRDLEPGAPPHRAPPHRRAPRCDDVTTMALAFVGTAQHGRVVLGCQPSLASWSLDSPGSTPAWRTAWAGTELQLQPDAHRHQPRPTPPLPSRC